MQGLSYNATYYFALRVLRRAREREPDLEPRHRDDARDPAHRGDPTSLNESLLTGDVSVQHLTIRNTGEGRLDFSTASPESLVTGLLSRIAVTVDPDPGPGGGAADPRPGIIGGRGPDRGGYRWRSSEDAGGPAFGWVDIASDGTAIGFASDDDVSAPIAIGFEFPFYGRKLTSVRVGSNGYLTFGGAGTWNANRPLPSAAGARGPRGAVVAGLRRGRPALGAVPARARTVRGLVPRPAHAGLEPHAPHVPGHPRAQRPDRLPVPHARRLDRPGTVGMQDPTHTTGLLVAFNATFLHDRQAVEFLPLGQWLSVSPPSGRVAAGASMPLDVTFDATGLFGGDYNGIGAHRQQRPVPADHAAWRRRCT